MRNWISDGEETSTPVVSRAGGDEEIESVITNGPLLAKARGGKPSGSVARMPLDPMLEAVTEEGKSDADVQAEVGMSDADKKVPYKLLNRTRQTEVKGNLKVNSH